MTFIVSIRFGADPKRAHRALRENPDLDRAVRQGIKEAGLIRCTRLVGEGEFMDIDEWPNSEARDAFAEAAAPQLARWRELMGVTDTEVRTWRSAEPDEDF